MQRQFSPIRLALTLLVLIFCVEGAMMFVLDAFAPKGTPAWAEAVIDAGVLTALVSVFVWKFFVKPLRFAMMSKAAQAQTVLDGAVDAVLTIAEDGTIVSCNPATERMFGFQSGALAGKNVKILMPEPHAAAHDGYIARYLQTGQARVIGRARELEALRQDGSVFPIELSVTECRIDGARRFTGIIRDITVRRAAERAIAQETDRYRALMDTAIDGIHIVANARLVDANPAFLRMLGYTEEEALGLHVSAWEAGLSAENLQAMIRGAQTQGLRQTLETKHRRKDGSIFDVEVSMNSFEIDGQGYTLCAARDITERKRSENSLRRFRAAMDASADAIYLVDRASMQFIDVNAAACRMRGQTREKILALGPTGVLSQSREDLERAYDAVIARGGQSQSFEIQRRRQDGSQITIELERSAQHTGDGWTIVTVARDISARKAAEHRIERLTQIYAVLSHTNQAIVRARSEDDLYERISQIPIERAGMHGLVLRIADEDKALRAVAFSESMRSMADQPVNTTDQDLPRHQEFIASAYRDDRVVVNNDIIADNHKEPWSALIRATGIRSTAAVPIRRGGKPIGVVALSATEADYFDADMHALLEEMAIDMAFAMDNFDYERRRKRAEQGLSESEGRFRSLVEQSLTGICIAEDGRFTYVNPRFAEIHGYAPQEMIGMRVIDTIAEEDHAAFHENVRKRASGEVKSVAYSLTARRKDGSTVRVGVNGAIATMEGRPIIVSMLQDISEREQAQRRIEAYMKQLEDAMLGTVAAVSAMVELRDPYTAGHEGRVGLIAKAIGAEMDLPEQTCKGLEHIGRVHDLGKISIPAEILSKPGRLSDLEFSIIKTHPQAGYDILKDVAFPWPVAMAVLQHHERLDGSGYPNGAKADEIILEARILAVADVIEAMGSHRPYRATLGIDVALEEILKFRGLRYDERAVDACVRLFREKGFQLPQ